ncbi:hypothetical protein [Nitrosomonas sp.]|uniref:hypothetical protein n=1 Tax=Nitrosomonas sp. TaxID=42353 RepID=UPI001D61677D|nr:hypothetical protein [Nitrosomonas sp.]MCB1947875.1 hypothetical protein [Nitrosomonas sp.]
MTTVTFEVKTYEIKISRELTATSAGVKSKFPAYILCRGDNYHVVIYILDDSSPVPSNTFIPERKRGTIFVPKWQYEWFIDLLRNEKPVYCYLNNQSPDWNALYTGQEPVGEHEM